MIRIPSFIACAVLLACTPRAERADSVPAPAATADGRTTGTIAVVGSAPVNVHTVLLTREGRSFRVAGPLADEVRRLAGAEVAVQGPIQPSPDPMSSGEIQVTEYEIVTIDGEPVLTGEIIAVDGQWVRLRTPDGREVYLSGAPEDFRVGQKVWIQGPTSVSVQAYGVIRP